MVVLVPISIRDNKEIAIAVPSIWRAIELLTLIT